MSYTETLIRTNEIIREIREQLGEDYLISRIDGISPRPGIQIISPIGKVVHFTPGADGNIADEAGRIVQMLRKQEERKE